MSISDMEDLLDNLSFASQDGDVCRVKDLIAKGADPSINAEFNTALVDAINSRCYEIVGILLDAGANPDRTDPISGSSPLGSALSLGDGTLLKLLIEHGATMEEKLLLDMIPSCDSPELIVEAISEGFDPNYIEEKWGRTPLHIASTYGYIKTAKALIEAGANASTRDRNGAKPSDLAKLNGHFDVVVYLKNHEKA